MRVIYRITDYQVMTLEPGHRKLDDYIEPIWQDTFRHKFLPINQPVADTWLRLEGGALRQAAPPPDHRDITLWRFKLKTLNEISFYISGKRRMLLPPVVDQHKIYQWKVDEARKLREQGFKAEQGFPLVRAYAKMHNLSLKNASTMILMKHEQFYNQMIETEIQRAQLIKRAVEATQVSELQQVTAELESQALAGG